LVLSNDDYENLYVEEIEAAGEHAIQIHGAGAQVDHVSCDVVFDFWIGEGKRSQSLALPYPSSSPDDCLEVDGFVADDFEACCALPCVTPGSASSAADCEACCELPWPALLP
jgi:hypothetical protein